MPFAHPYWLIALLLIPILGIAAAMASRRQSRLWGQLVASRLRQHLIRSGNPIPRWLSLAFLLAAIALILFGLARPQGDGGTVAEKSMARNLLLVLDLSRSMGTEDVQPSRLDLAKLAIYELLEAMPNDRIGLIGFAGDAHLYAPLTIDHNAVRETVEQMDEEWPTTGGSDLGAAVSLGIETLKDTNQRNNAMVILTDGERHQGGINQMAADAREAGVYILAVGVGTEDGGYVPHPDFPSNRMLDDKGNPVLSRMQSDVLIELTSKTNGAFAIAGSGADIPAMVSTSIAGLDAYELEVRERQLYIEFYQWLVLPAILLLFASLIAGTRWRGVSTSTAAATAIALLAIAMTTPAGLAEEATPSLEEKQMERYRQLAERALLKGNRARYRLGEATAAYRLQNWSRASDAYSKALRSDSAEVRTAAHHGLGNTLFQKGWQRFLDVPYAAEVDAAPAMKRFDLAVRAKLEKLKTATDKELNSESFNYSDIELAVLDWTDSARHFQSILAIDADDEGAKQNHELTIRYLRRLKELLDEDEQQTEQSIPETMPQPQPGDGDSGDQSDDGSGDQDPENPGDDGSGDKDPENPENPGDGDPNDNPGDQDPKDPDDNGGRDPAEQTDEQEIPDHSDNIRPGESPDQRARRILRDSSDVEKGPLTSGRIQYRKPDKDW